MDEDLADAAASTAAFAARPGFRFTKPELVDAIRDLHAVTSAATGVLAGLVHEAVGLSVPTQDDATSTVTWLRDLLRIAPAEARTLTSLGDLLAARPRLGGAVTSGAVKTSQAAVIGQVLDDVPDAGGDRGVDPDLVDRIEVELVGHAARFEPRYLCQLGRRIVAHINPELADRQLQERLEREERHAALGAGSRCHRTGSAASACSAASTSRLPPRSPPRSPH